MPFGFCPKTLSGRTLLTGVRPFWTQKGEKNRNRPISAKRHNFQALGPFSG